MNSMVEWKKLDTLLGFEQPTPYLVKSTEYDDSYDVPVLTAGQSLLLGYTNETKGIYKASKDNPTIIFDDFTTSFHWIDFNFKVKSSAMKMLRPKKDVNFRYVYYSMCGIKFAPGGHQRHWISKYSQFEIPIPSLSEQTRIVGILDTFTASIENLKEQIAQRRKQYEYYRDQLLDLEGKEGVEMKRLATICEIKGRIGFRGYTREDQVSKDEGALVLTATNIVNQRIDYRNNTYITWTKYNESPEIMVKEGDIIVCQRGSIGKIAIIENLQEKATINPQLLLLKNITCNNRFLIYYLLSRNFQDSLNKIVGHGTVQMIAQKDFKELQIPLVNKKEQSRIVSVLDTFEASISNLEAQLKEREKQYEYYRNKLLTFE